MQVKISQKKSHGDYFFSFFEFALFPAPHRSILNSSYDFSTSLRRGKTSKLSKLFASMRFNENSNTVTSSSSKNYYVSLMF